MKTRQQMGRNVAAFVLLELTLAVFLIVSGLLVLLTLVLPALRAGDAGRFESQASQFADTVFNTFRAQAERAAQSGSGDWAEFWNSCRAGRKELSLAVGPCVAVVETDRGTEPWRPADFTQTVAGWTNRYLNPTQTVTLIQISPESVTTTVYKIQCSLTLFFPSGSNGCRADLILDVLPAEPVSRLGPEPVRFYTEFPKMGDL